MTADSDSVIVSRTDSEPGFTITGKAPTVPVTVTGQVASASLRGGSDSAVPVPGSDRAILSPSTTFFAAGRRAGSDSVTGQSGRGPFADTVGLSKRYVT